MDNMIVIKYGKSIPMEKLLKFQKMIKDLFSDRKVLIMPHAYHIEEVPEEELNKLGYFKRVDAEIEPKE